MSKPNHLPEFNNPKKPTSDDWSTENQELAPVELDENEWDDEDKKDLEAKKKLHQQKKHGLQLM